jgi:hypothetical protein
VAPETIVDALTKTLKAEFGPSRRMPLQAIVFEARRS